MFGYHLGLGSQTIEDIGTDNHTAAECRMSLYSKWIRHHGSRATYQELAMALYDHHHTDLVEGLAEALNKDKIASSARVEKADTYVAKSDKLLDKKEQGILTNEMQTKKADIWQIFVTGLDNEMCTIN